MAIIISIPSEVIFSLLKLVCGRANAISKNARQAMRIRGREYFIQTLYETGMDCKGLRLEIVRAACLFILKK